MCQNYTTEEILVVKLVNQAKCRHRGDTGTVPYLKQYMETKAM